MNQELHTLTEVLRMLNAQMYIERIIIIANILITAVGIGLIVATDKFGAKPDDSDTHGLQKGVWITYLVICFLLIGLNCYLICFFRKMGKFYLETLKVNKGFN